MGNFKIANSISKNSRLICLVWLFQDRVLINQWKDEIINGFKLSAQIMANMNKKVRNKYGADFGIGGIGGGENQHPPLEHRNSNGS